MKKAERKLITVLIIIILAVIAYGIVPVALATSPGSMHSGNTYYIYGTVTNRIEIDNTSAFEVDDSGHNFGVFYNGSAPAVGSHVLVHGKYSDFFGRHMSASSIYTWYYSL